MHDDPLNRLTLQVLIKITPLSAIPVPLCGCVVGFNFQHLTSQYCMYCVCLVKPRRTDSKVLSGENILKYHTLDILFLSDPSDFSPW